MPDPCDITQRVLDRCHELGFALAGVTDAAPTQYERELLDWLAAGKHGEMEYLSRNVELRIDPRALLPGAQSIICVADRYWSETSKQQNGETAKRGSRAADGNPRAFGRIARYARGDDYHVVMKKRLRTLCNELSETFPDESFRACVDTAPVLERELAQRAGLGAVGKNTLLIQRGVGSYLLLGEVITTLSLAASHPADPDPCGSCTRCIDACPTHAITPWSVDATRCISYLTIEHRGEIDPQFHEAMGDWVFGCDICQEVCPHNQPKDRSFAERTSRNGPVHSAYTPRREGFDLLEILDWEEEARQNEFIKSAMKRAKLDMMKRNALIAAGNALRVNRDRHALRERIHSIVEDSHESDLVRRAAAIILAALPGHSVAH